MIEIIKTVFVAILMMLYPFFASAMEFSLFDGADECSGCLIIKADGEITESTPDKFRIFLADTSLEKKKLAVVVLNSPGGSLLGGIEFGRLIRSNGFDTHIGRIKIIKNDETYITDGQCASACAYAFLGGRKRSKGLKSKYGLHQISTTSNVAVPLNKAVESTQNILSEVSKYVENMGASPEIVTIATRTKSEKVNWIESHALLAYMIINSSGLSQQQPWKMVQPKAWSVNSVLGDGTEELILMSCREIPSRLNKRGHVKISLSPSNFLPEDSPYMNSHTAAVVLVTLNNNNIIENDITVFFSGLEPSIHGIDIPFWALTDVLRDTNTLSISISYPDNFPTELSLQEHHIPKVGLNNAIAELSRSCPHLRR